MWLFSFLSTPRLADAEAELREELREFSHDGLVQLRMDLERKVVRRGTWDGCVLSYRRGFAGSVDSDRKARRGNAFTRFWDAEHMNEEQVLRVLDLEVLDRRSSLLEKGTGGAVPPKPSNPNVPAGLPPVEAP